MMSSVGSWYETDISHTFVYFASEVTVSTVIQNCNAMDPAYKRQTLVIEKGSHDNHRVVHPVVARNVFSKSDIEYNGMLNVVRIAREHVEEGNEPFVPEWVQNQGTVLRFQAVYLDSSHPNDGVKVAILYFPVDDTYEVLFDGSENKGKVLLKRHCNISSMEHWEKPNPHNIKIGQCVNILGHRFEIIGVSLSTREYLESKGCNVGSPCEPKIITNENDAQEKQTRTFNCKRRQRITSYLSHGENIKTLFTENLPIGWKGVVLRFWARDGDSTEYFIKYFMEDSSIELFEFLDSSLKTTRKILSRNNFVDPVGSLIRFVSPGEVRFKPENFFIGERVKICGRDMVIHKADSESKAWLAANIKGADLINLQDISFKGNDEKRERSKVEEEPQEALCPAPRGLEKMQFLAKFRPHYSGEPAVDDFNNERKFIIHVYVSDFSVAIKEVGIQTHDGFGIKFLERQRVWEDLINKKGVLQPSEFYIGASVRIYGHQFEILDADRVTLEYIADHPEYFEQANGTNTLTEVREALKQTATDGTSKYQSENILCMLEQILPHVSKAAIISSCMLLAQIDCTPQK